MRVDAALSGTFLVLSAGACAIATLGLLANSVAVIIGAMLIAPLMTPIVSVAWSLVNGDALTLRAGLLALAAGAAVSIGFSAALAALLRSH